MKKILFYFSVLSILSCSSKQHYITEEQLQSDTISTSSEPMPDLKADRTQDVKGYWKKNGTDSVYVQPYKRRTKTN